MAYERKTALDLLAVERRDDEYEPQPDLQCVDEVFTNAFEWDELSVEFARTLDINPLFIERVFRNVEGASIWCDVVQSSQLESCLDMAELSLDDALYDSEINTAGRFPSCDGVMRTSFAKHPSRRCSFVKYLVNIVQPTSGGIILCNG